MSYLFQRIKCLLEELSDLDRAASSEDQEELARLANHPDENVVKAVAGNPATSSNDLNKIHDNYAPLHPMHTVLSGNPNISIDLLNKYLTNTDFSSDVEKKQAVLNNPLLSILNLENPHLYQLKPAAVAVIAKHSEDPDLLTTLAHHKNFRVQKEVFNNKKTPKHILPSIIRNPTIDHMELLANLNNLSPDTYHRAIDVLDNSFNLDPLGPGLYHLGNLLKSNKLDATHISRLNDAFIDHYKDELSFNRNTPPEIITKILNTMPKTNLSFDDVDTLGSIAARRDLTPEHYKKIENYHPYFYSMPSTLLKNPKTPGNILQKLLSLPSEHQIRKDLLKHPNTNSETLHALAEKMHEDPIFNGELESNSNLFFEHPNTSRETEEYIKNKV